MHIDPPIPPPDPRVLDHLGELPVALFPDSFVRSADLVERYAAAWRLEIAHRLELPRALAGGATPREAAERGGFIESFIPTLTSLLADLAAEGYLERADGPRETERRYHPGPLPLALRERPALDPLRQALLDLDPRNGPTLELLDTAAQGYPLVARGQAKSEDLLLGPRGIPLWDRYFSNENPLYAINNRIAALAAARRIAPPGFEPTTAAGLRLLEVGAGFGSGSQALLEALEEKAQGARIAEYRITEPSPFFRRRAQRTLTAAWPQTPLGFGGLDIDLAWEDQGVAAGSLDLIFGINVLHVAHDLEQALRQALGSLAPGGWLVAGECLRPFPDQPIGAELIFQLLEGFHQVRTDPRLRPNPGFLTPEQWALALEAAGFQAVETVPDLVPIRQLTRRFLAGAVCGRRPA